jgi:DNA-binding PadR family transcriptional regulator
LSDDYPLVLGLIEHGPTSVLPHRRPEDREVFNASGPRVRRKCEVSTWLCGVETRVLNQAVRRNIERFPEEFMFQLKPGEWKNLTSQTVISSVHGGRRRRPYAFTEQGVAMLSSVLRNPRAVAVNIEVMRAFVSSRTCSRRSAFWWLRRGARTRRLDSGHDRVQHPDNR